MPVSGKRIPGGVKTGQSGVEMSQPQDTLAIQKNRFHVVASERIVIVRVVPVGDETLSVVAVEARLRSEPKEAQAVLNHILNAVAPCPAGQLKDLEPGVEVGKRGGCLCRQKGDTQNNCRLEK